MVLLVACHFIAGLQQHLCSRCTRIARTAIKFHALNPNPWTLNARNLTSDSLTTTMLYEHCQKTDAIPSMTGQRCLLAGILRSTSIRVAKLICGEEEVQEAVHLAFPSVTVEEDADPGHHALEEEDGECPHKCQADCFQVGDAASVLLGTTTRVKQHNVK